MALIPLVAAGPLVGAKDIRTIRRRLAALDVPTVAFGSRHYVDPAAIDRSIARAERSTDMGMPAQRPMVLRPGERLW